MSLFDFFHKSKSQTPKAPQPSKVYIHTQTGDQLKEKLKSKVRNECNFDPNVKRDFLEQLTLLHEVQYSDEALQKEKDSAYIDLSIEREAFEIEYSDPSSNPSISSATSGPNNTSLSLEDRKKYLRAISPNKAVQAQIFRVFSVIDKTTSNRLGYYIQENEEGLVAFPRAKDNPPVKIKQEQDGSVTITRTTYTVISNHHNKDVIPSPCRFHTQTMTLSIKPDVVQPGEPDTATTFIEQDQEKIDLEVEDIKKIKIQREENPAYQNVRQCRSLIKKISSERQDGTGTPQKARNVKQKTDAQFLVAHQVVESYAQRQRIWIAEDCVTEMKLSFHTFIFDERRFMTAIKILSDRLELIATKKSTIAEYEQQLRENCEKEELVIFIEELQEQIAQEEKDLDLHFNQGLSALQLVKFSNKLHALKKTNQGAQQVLIVEQFFDKILKENKYVKTMETYSTRITSGEFNQIKTCVSVLKDDLSSWTGRVACIFSEPKLTVQMQKTLKELGEFIRTDPLARTDKDTIQFVNSKYYAYIKNAFNSLFDVKQLCCLYKQVNNHINTHGSLHINDLAKFNIIKFTVWNILEERSISRDYFDSAFYVPNIKPAEREKIIHSSIALPAYRSDNEETDCYSSRESSPENSYKTISSINAGV